jgi:hypothetical protein
LNFTKTSARNGYFGLFFALNTLEGYKLRDFNKKGKKYRPFHPQFAYRPQERSHTIPLFISTASLPQILVKK